MMKILFITNIPSPYRVDFFNEFGKKCDLTVCYERRSASDRDNRWISDTAKYYTVHFTNARPVGTDKSIGFDVVREIKRESFDRLIITGYASPSVMLAITYCRFRHIPYIMESDGGFNKPDQSFKKALKSFLLCGAQAHFTTCEEYFCYLMELGIPKEKIHKYPFTSLKEKDIAPAPASDEEKERLRAELGITEQKVVLSVGRFNYGKGFDVLLNAAKDFSADTGTYIVGGIPGEEYVAQKERLGLTNVHFVDFKQKEDLKKWYRAADVFVLPTREDIWGLVINEAMAQGLSVVTTDRCIAGLELLEKNFIVPVDDANAIADRVNALLDNNELRVLTANRNLQKIGDYTIESMAAYHNAILLEKE